MTTIPTIQLPDNTTMPTIGFGTWQLFGSWGQSAIEHAITAGYRLLDTAQMYKNEAEVSAAISASGISRNEFFITTKLKTDDPAAVPRLINGRLDTLQTDYIDLLLIHWPPGDDAGNVATWQHFITAQQQGLLRHIGVSNFSIHLIDRLKTKTGVLPAVNQIEVNPYSYPKELILECRQQNIVIQAYSPFGQGTLLHDADVKAMATAYGRSVPQLLNRWCIQHNLVPLPRSRSQDHIQENIDVFDFVISQADMNRLDCIIPRR